MTQEQFAELLDISVDFLSLVERGLNAPSFESIEAFSITLGIPVRDFFDFSVAYLSTDLLVAEINKPANIGIF